MTAAILTALGEFDRDIKRAKDLLELMKKFREFAASTVPEEVTNGNTPWVEAEELAEIAPGVRTDLPLLSGSLLLYICGRFESFVRELVIALADDLNSKFPVFHDLPDNVKKELFRQTLNVANAPQRYNYTSSDAEALIVSLGNNLTHTAGPFTVRSDVLAITESNMHHRTVAEIFKRVNISDIWHDIAKQAKIRTYLEKYDDGDCRAEVTRELDRIMKDRNRLAHPASNGVTFLDADQVVGVCDFLLVLGSVIVEVVQIPRK